MTLMLDATALLARYLDVAFRPALLEAMDADHEWCASALALTEALMVVDRIGDDPERAAHLRACLRDDWDCVAVVPTDAGCLARAAELGRRYPLGTIDALVMAAADRLPRPLTFATLDPVQIPVALALGFEVLSP